METTTPPTWIEYPSTLPYKVWGHTLVTLNEKLFLIGGDLENTGRCDSIWQGRINTKTNTIEWQEMEMNFITFTEIQVPARQWDAHRRQCALDNRDKLEHLSSPSPGMAAFPHYISSAIHSIEPFF